MVVLLRKTRLQIAHLNLECWSSLIGSLSSNGNENSLENTNIWEMVTILWLLLVPRILYCRQSTLQMDWESAVEVNMENKTFTVVCSRCR